ncbi:cytochrome c1 heme lyase, partial [Kalaharituber pfeilii]
MADSGSNSRATPANTSGAGACPVDHNTRAAWLVATKQNGKPPVPSHPVDTPSPTATCDSTTLTAPPALQTTLPPTLSPTRQVSTIPRALPTSPGTNTENLHSHTSPSGHWIYPSEQMFFAAMQRKKWDPQATDMQHIVPIHNAVNEKAWAEIKRWEAGRGGDTCGGPKLVSFQGDSSKLTPKARLMVLLGYQRPFDRHDWRVDRCGKQIDYVIDFYSGKSDPSRPEAVSFYLDVRPKINSIEGVWMRMSRFASSLF